MEAHLAKRVWDVKSDWETTCYVRGQMTAVRTLQRLPQEMRMRFDELVAAVEKEETKVNEAV